MVGILDNQVALVTGGGSGIGRAVVARFVEEGARVAVMERVTSRVGELRDAFGEKVIGIAGNVAQADDSKRAVAETLQVFGRLDVLVGNAGIFDVYASVEEMPEEQLARAFDELFAVNVKGLIYGARAAMPELRKSKGSMVFTASVAGQNSGGGGALYTASKHAVVGLVRELAVELAPDIRVNGVAPGGTMTDLRGLSSLGNDDRSQFAAPDMAERLQAGNPLHLALAPDDLAGAYLFLSSRRDARGITGTIVTVDAGGMLRIPRPRSPHGGR